MLYSLYRRLRGKNKPARNIAQNKTYKQEYGTDKVNAVNTDATEVKIPVGGIAADGTVYDHKVYPDGRDELLYKEVRINDSNQAEKTKQKDNS